MSFLPDSSRLWASLEWRRRCPDSRVDASYCGNAGHQRSHGRDYWRFHRLDSIRVFRTVERREFRAPSSLGSFHWYAAAESWRTDWYFHCNNSAVRNHTSVPRRCATWFDRVHLRHCDWLRWQSIQNYPRSDEPRVIHVLVDSLPRDIAVPMRRRDRCDDQGSPSGHTITPVIFTDSNRWIAVSRDFLNDKVKRWERRNVKSMERPRS